jgi:hypothetical protein
MPFFVCSPGNYAAGIGYVSELVGAQHELTVTLPHPPYHVDPVSLVAVDMSIHMLALPTTAYFTLWTDVDSPVNFDIAPLLSIGDNHISVDVSVTIGPAAFWSLHIETGDTCWLEDMMLRTAACPPEEPPAILQFTGVVTQQSTYYGIIDGYKSLDGLTLFLHWHNPTGTNYTSVEVKCGMVCTEPITYFVAKWSPAYPPQQNWWGGSWNDLHTGWYKPTNRNTRTLLDSGPSYAVYRIGWNNPTQPTEMYAGNTNTLRYPTLNGQSPTPFSLEWQIEILEIG